MQLHYQNNILFWDQCDLSQLANKYGTPLHVCNAQSLQQSIESFMDPFKKEKIHLSCFYSVKTNPVPDMLLILKNSGIGVEIISEYEMWLVKRLGFEGANIVINGPAKSKQLISDAFNLNVKALTVESKSEFQHISSITETNSKKLNVGIRICPMLSSSRFDFTLNSAAKDSPFGMLPNSRDLKSSLEVIQKKDNLNFVGFQIHLGSGIKSSRPYQKAFSILEDVILNAVRCGCKSKLINIGGGFGNPSAPVLSFYQLTSFFLKKKPIKLPRSKKERLISDIVRELSKLLARLHRSGISIEEIIAEPGRRISASTQLTLLSVLDVIVRPDDRRFLICNGGAMSLSPMLLTEQHNVLPLINRGSKLRNYAVLGNLPSALDRVAYSVSLPELKIGDQIAIMDTGAYVVSFNNNFGGPRPAIALIEGSKSKLIRQRENFDDLTRHDFCINEELLC